MASKTRKTPEQKDPTRTAPAPKSGPKDADTDQSLDDRLDEALRESFPASDPPAVHRLSRGGSFLP